MITTNIENLRPGEYFKLKINGCVYVRDYYNRFTKKYGYTKFDDINAYYEKKRGSKVIVDFDF